MSPRAFIIYRGPVSGLVKTLEEAAVLVPIDTGFLVVLPRPYSCKCGRAAAIVINIDGQTRCLKCDAKHRGGVP